MLYFVLHLPFYKVFIWQPDDGSRVDQNMVLYCIKTKYLY